MFRMIHIVTGGGIVYDSLPLCDTTERLIPPRSEPSFVSTVFHKPGTELADLHSYSDGSTTSLRLVPSPSFAEVISQLSKIILADERRSLATAKSSKTDPDEIIVAVACRYDTSRQVTDALSRELKKAGSSIVPFNFYTALKIPSQEKLVEYLKLALGSEHIYPDDPVAFGYALYTAMSV